MSQGRPTIQIVAAVGWCQLPDWSCLTHGRVSLAKFRNETSRRGKLCNVCEMLVCKLVYLFIVFGEHGRYISNINHLW